MPRGRRRRAREAREGRVTGTVTWVSKVRQEVPDEEDTRSWWARLCGVPRATREVDAWVIDYTVPGQEVQPIPTYVIGTRKDAETAAAVRLADLTLTRNMKRAASRVVAPCGEIGECSGECCEEVR